MKIEQKNKAIILRKDGWTLNKIAKEVKCSKASISVWVRGVIPLRKIEKVNNYTKIAHMAQLNKKMFRAKRQQSQKEGQDIYVKQDKEYAFGCALFWAEGDKRKNAVDILIFL